MINGHGNWFLKLIVLVLVLI